MTTTDPLPAPEDGYRPQLEGFPDRLRWIRTFVLRVSELEMARRTGYPHATLSSWERGSRPRDKAEVAMRYQAACKDAGYAIPTHWILYGGDGLVTKGDASYTGLLVVDEGQLRLPIDLPQSTTEPELTLV